MLPTSKPESWDAADTCIILVGVVAELRLGGMFGHEGAQAPASGPTADSIEVGAWMQDDYAAFLCFFGLGLEGGHAPAYWLLV